MMKAIVWILGLLIALAVFLLFDAMLAERSETFHGTVMERYYKAAESNVGTGVTSGGDVAIVIENSKEEWTVMVRLDDGVVSASASAEQWERAERHEPVELHYFKGRFTGVNLGWFVNSIGD